jgi:hypothetical protein
MLGLSLLGWTYLFKRPYASQHERSVSLVTDARRAQDRSSPKAPTGIEPVRQARLAPLAGPAGIRGDAMPAGVPAHLGYSDSPTASSLVCESDARANGRTR